MTYLLALLFACSLSPAAQDVLPRAISEVDLARAYQALDHDGDGRIARAEALRAPGFDAARFAYFDSDRDGLILYPEFFVPTVARLQRAGLALDQALQELLRTKAGPAEDDGDGEEATASQRSYDFTLALCRFSTLDRDQDGFLAPLPQSVALDPARPWLGADGDADGLLGPREFVEYQRRLRLELLAATLPRR